MNSSRIRREACSKSKCKAWFPKMHDLLSLPYWLLTSFVKLELLSLAEVAEHQKVKKLFFSVLFLLNLISFRNFATCLTLVKFCRIPGLVGTIH